MTSASPTLAQVIPIAPAANCNRAIWTHLWVLICGRRLTPTLFANAAIPAMLRWRISSETTRAGVSIDVVGATMSCDDGARVAMILPSGYRATLHDAAPDTGTTGKV